MQETETKGLRICAGRGFQMFFQNGWGTSNQRNWSQSGTLHHWKASMRVQKRDGRWDSFDLNKIKRALLMALSASGGGIPDPMPLVHRVMERLSPGDLSVSDIVEACELELMDSGFHEAARSYISYRVERDLARSSRLKPDKAAIAEYIHAAKYARWVDGRREIFSETVDRVRDMHIRRYPQLATEIEEGFSAVKNRDLTS